MTHLKISPNQTTHEFLQALKTLITRTAYPKVIYSDNSKTIVAVAKWIAKISFDKVFQSYLNQNQIVREFNLSLAPWWGKQFEWIVSLVKECLCKVTSCSNLTKPGLENIILDVQIILNDRPPTYPEDDIQHIILTPNILIYEEPLQVPEKTPHGNKKSELKRQRRFIVQCKEFGEDGKIIEKEAQNEI